MFENLQSSPPDAIIRLMEMAKADPNPNKIDLGVGVYKNPEGATPILRSVKEAEVLRLAHESSKSYVSTLGCADFRKALLELILGETHPALLEGRIASAQATGGSGALRLGAELIKTAHPNSTVWVSTPTWANHVPLIGSTGLKLESYPYYNRETLGVDFTDMLACLEDQAKPGDTVLLHGCCHNPTGADLSPMEWETLATFIRDHELIPFIDLAYLGLGRSFLADSYGLKTIIDFCPESVFAVSCSKNFGLYRERVGLVATITSSREQSQNVQSQFGAIQRKLVSMPPHHGAGVVRQVLTSPELRKMWENELTYMRERIITLRGQLSDALNVQGGEVMARAIKKQHGMFSMLPLSEAQINRLRKDHSIYMLNSGRMNVAAANIDNIDRLARAILSVL